jgi:hypothetical protein
VPRVSLRTKRLAKIAAENEAAKDAREHGQALEIEGVKSKARAELEASKESGRNKRAEASIASRESQAAASRAAADSRAEKRGAGSQAKPSFRTAKLPGGKGWGLVDPATGKFSMDEKGAYIEAAPPYRERDAAKSSAPAPAPASAAPKASPGASRENPVDAQSMGARPPSGTWVRLPSGAVVQVP